MCFMSYNLCILWIEQRRAAGVEQTVGQIKLQGTATGNNTFSDTKATFQCILEEPQSSFCTTASFWAQGLHIKNGRADISPCLGQFSL